MNLFGYPLTANEAFTLYIAGYAAIVSTAVLAWDVIKWRRAGAKIRVSATAGMKRQVGGVIDPTAYISVTARNTGDRPTTITHLVLRHFSSWWRAYLPWGKPSAVLIVADTTPGQPIPHRLDVGDQWQALVEQAPALVDMAANGYLFACVILSTHDRETRARVSPP